MELSKYDLELAGCLRRLLKNRFILRSRNEKWFQTMINHRDKLQSVLDALLIQLDVNESLGLIYVRPKSAEIEEALEYRMGVKQALGPVASVLVFHLRHLRVSHYMNPSSNEVPLVTLAELREFAQVFNRANVDREFERAFRKGVDELLGLQVLIETSVQKDLFEMTAVCDILLPSDQIQEMKIRMDQYLNGQTLVDMKEDQHA